MKIINMHRRSYPVSPAALSQLMDNLASQSDNLWPRSMWPAMKFDRPLSVGATGGHKPIGYVVEKYESGRFIEFRFTAPSGFKGSHRFEIIEKSNQEAEFIHTIEMNLTGAAILSWPLVIRPLHDALVEDAFTQAEVSLGLQSQVRPWSLYVKILRYLMSRGKAGRQVFACNQQ